MGHPSPTLAVMAETPVDGPSTNTRGLGLMNRNRKVEIREARAWARRASFLNPKYRFRIFMALQEGTLNPMLEKAIWEMGELMPKGTKRDDLAEGVRGLFTLLLRRNLSEDPLAEPKKVEGRVVIDQPEQEPRAALPPRASIVPPSRPSKRTQGKATLRPGEEELA